jgi:hypothetical protein
MHKRVFILQKINSHHDLDVGSCASLSVSFSELALLSDFSIYQTASVRSHNCTRPGETLDNLRLGCPGRGRSRLAGFATEDIPITQQKDRIIKEDRVLP